MKIHLAFKTPDAVDYGIEHLSEEDKEVAKEVIEKFVEYGECLNVEIDTDLKTCNVIPMNS
jgi:hypothetical protein